MRSRFVPIVAAVLVAGISSGCSGQADGAARQLPNAKITVDAVTQNTHDITCTQIQWWLTVKASSGPAAIQAILHTEGDRAVIKTVNLDNFDGFHGVAGEGIGHADVTFANDVYTISGDAVGVMPEHPDQSKTVKFRIEARC